MQKTVLLHPFDFSLYDTMKKEDVTTPQLVETIVEGIRNKKGQHIVALDLRTIPEAPVEFMVIAEGGSTTQVNAITDEIDDYVRTQTHIHPFATDGKDNAEWVAMDYGTVFVHIMLRHMREYYDIENLWNDGTTIEYAAD